MTYSFQFNGDPTHIVVTRSDGVPVTLNEINAASEAVTFNIAPANSGVEIELPTQTWRYRDRSTTKWVNAPWTEDGSGGWNATMLVGWYTTPDKINTIEVVSTAAAVLPEYRFQFDGNPAHIVVTHSGGTPVALNQVQSVSEVTTFNIAPANSGVVVLKPLKDWGYYDRVTHKEVRAPWTEDGAGGWNATMLAGWYTTPDKINTIEVMSEATTPDVISPFNRIYDLNDDMLTELSDIMPSVYAGDPGTSPTPYDDSQFILNLLALPFKLPEAARADLVQIVIGNNDTGVMATQVVQDRVEIDLGVIEVAGLVDSSYDYSACVFQLITPFVGREMGLSPSDVIGKQVSVKYELDIYGGEITINVFNGDPEPFMSETDRVGTDIPIRVLNEVVGSQGRYQTTNNGILKAFIRVTRKELVDSEFANLTTTVGVLGSQSGYVELVNADLDGIGDSSTVVDILKGGVVIR